MEKNLFGNHPVLLPPTDSQSPPPAFASDPLKHVSEAGSPGKDFEGYTAVPTTGSAKPSAIDIVEIDGLNSASAHSNHEANFTKSSSPPAVSKYYCYFYMYTTVEHLNLHKAYK